MFDFDVVTGPGDLARLAEARARRGTNPLHRPAASPVITPGAPAENPAIRGKLPLVGGSEAKNDPI